MDVFANAHQAALINLGCNPFISLIATIVVVGVVVWLAITLLGFATFVAEPFKAMAIKVIYALGIAYCVLIALQIIFGIIIFQGMTPIGCGG
jgi:hypothetical protein